MVILFHERRRDEYIMRLSVSSAAHRSPPLPWEAWVSTASQPVWSGLVVANCIRLFARTRKKRSRIRYQNRPNHQLDYTPPAVPHTLSHRNTPFRTHSGHIQSHKHSTRTNEWMYNKVKYKTVKWQRFKRGSGKRDWERKNFSLPRRRGKKTLCLIISEGKQCGHKIGGGNIHFKRHIAVHHKEIQLR